MAIMTLFIFSHIPVQLKFLIVIKPYLGSLALEFHRASPHSMLGLWMGKTRWSVEKVIKNCLNFVTHKFMKKYSKGNPPGLPSEFLLLMLYGKQKPGDCFRRPHLFA